MSKFLHIVCLDAPSPPDYGGAIDMFYKIKSLAEIGIKIKLHYFHYKKERSINGLEKYCSEITAYKRETSIAGFALNKPYVIASRINKQLINNLNRDNHPVLLEGFHCTGIIPFLKKDNRKIIIRVHNDEAVYYHFLAISERNWLRKVYCKIESKLLSKYQGTLPNFCTYAFISELDKKNISSRNKLQYTQFVPSFLPWQIIKPLEGIGSYGLYHGNLTVAENKESVIWLIENVFSYVNYPFIIAGKNASRALQSKVKQFSNITIVDDPSTTKLDELITNAHVHILPSLNQTGVKLKLLNALFNGRFCITNERGIKGSGLEKACLIAEDADEYIKIINTLKQTPFSLRESALRQDLLQLYNNDINARKIIAELGYTGII
ncbi:glycosyltransferase [Chitinophagaceae bacterium LB-8]|uniref:Glycosyltransferase n=1 Tax=Paraflavisolibacter caeni TaxID=2982496 RepID=A0A9X2XZA3_9BACT|nr:glycosyltransferase family 4 protein [Paraflavisolibacter caeni]MCU7552176.1 glycosyltransferase [Paraflavisolibacter caeni]